jgi:predicted RNase H-like HicB family nuclease
MKYLTYTIVLTPEPEGGFTVTVPALQGCVTYGRDLDNAKEMATDAIEAYIVSLKKHHQPVPSDNTSFVSTVTLARRLPVYA